MSLFSWIKNLFSKKQKREVKDIYILSEKSLKLILQYEVGNKGYYNRFLDHPTYPQASSGVTIGIGYDLGYNSAETVKKDWKNFLSKNDLKRITSVVGYRGGVAESHAKLISDITIPWDSAVQVFQETTVPKFINYTLKAFPQCEDLHPDAFGALVSIVFNRGASMKGSRRSEMRNIRSLVLQKDYKSIAREIRSMKRIWRGKGLDGLLKRREAEAILVESCI